VLRRPGTPSHADGSVAPKMRPTPRAHGRLFRPGVFAGSGPGGTVRLERVLLGFDAATWQIVEPLARSGCCPTSSASWDEGVTGPWPLANHLEPRGVDEHRDWRRPATSRITDFVTTNRDGQRVPFTSNQRRRLAVWNILSGAGRTVGW